MAMRKGGQLSSHSMCCRPFGQTWLCASYLECNVGWCLTQYPLCQGRLGSINAVIRSKDMDEVDIKSFQAAV